MIENLQGTDLTCQQIIEFIRAYLDGELPQRERIIFDLHLAICPDCVNYLHSYQATMDLERQVEVALPAISDELVQAILAARSK